LGVNISLNIQFCGLFTQRYLLLFRYSLLTHVFTVRSVNHLLFNTSIRSDQRQPSNPYLHLPNFSTSRRSLCFFFFQQNDLSFWFIPVQQAIFTEPETVFLTKQQQKHTNSYKNNNLTHKWGNKVLTLYDSISSSELYSYIILL
jgi:hypothetical protein